MKSFIVLASLIVGTAAQAQLSIGLQPYLYCFPTAENKPDLMDYEVHLENAAIADATGITVFKTGAQIFTAPIDQTQVVDKYTVYVGQTFVGSRFLVQKNPSTAPMENLRLGIVLDQKPIYLKMECTTVQ